MADLTRLCITLPADHSGDDADMLLALLALHVPHGWQEESLPTGEMRCIVHSGHVEYCTRLAGLLEDAMPVLSIRSEIVQETNWAEAWKEFFTPVEGGEHFLVLAPWMEEERGRALAEGKRIPVLIEPKTAFGTGHHATTALCLEAVSSLFSQGVLKPGTRFLDLGTGSGILGIACARLGLAGDGLDIDPVAVENALENRALNNVAPEDFRVAEGGVDVAADSYGCILANILAAPLKALAAPIAARLAPGGALILSGLLDIQADSVAEAYKAQGMGEPLRLRNGEWAALVWS